MSLFNNMEETVEISRVQGIYKGKSKNSKLLTIGILGGMFIALAGMGQIRVLKFTVDSNIPELISILAGAIFPVGLMLCVLLGGSLFTGNCLLVLNYLEKDLTIKDVLRNLSITWIGNLLGCVAVSYIAYKGGSLDGEKVRIALMGIVDLKLSASFSQAIFSGFLCNILVAGTILMSMSAKDIVGKTLIIWFGILLFVLSSYQHVVANMFYLSAAKLIDANSVNVGKVLVDHLLPVTIGNFLSGAIFYPIILKKLYPKKEKDI